MTAIVLLSFVLFLTADRTLAFPSGAGGPCEHELPGVLGMKSPHTSVGQLSEDEFPPLDAYGTHVQIDGVFLDPNSIDGSAFRSGVEHTLSVVSTTGKPFKGILIRIASFTFGDVSGVLTPLDDGVLQEAHACSQNQPDAVGLTHTNSKDKQQVSASFTYERSDSFDALLLEVTIVVSVQEWYYRPYFLVPVPGPAEPPRTLPEAERTTHGVSHTTAGMFVEGDIDSLEVQGAFQANFTDCPMDSTIDTKGGETRHFKLRSAQKLQEHRQWSS